MPSAETLSLRLRFSSISLRTCFERDSAARLQRREIMTELCCSFEDSVYNLSVLDGSATIKLNIDDCLQSGFLPVALFVSK
jgi:hypothetical protein